MLQERDRIASLRSAAARAERRFDVAHATQAQLRVDLQALLAGLHEVKSRARVSGIKEMDIRDEMMLSLAERQEDVRAQEELAAESAVALARLEAEQRVAAAIAFASSAARRPPPHYASEAATRTASAMALAAAQRRVAKLEAELSHVSDERHSLRKRRAAAVAPSALGAPRRREERGAEEPRSLRLREVRNAIAAQRRALGIGALGLDDFLRVAVASAAPSLDRQSRALVLRRCERERAQLVAEAEVRALEERLARLHELRSQLARGLSPAASSAVVGRAERGGGRRSGGSGPDAAAAAAPHSHTKRRTTHAQQLWRKRRSAAVVAAAAASDPMAVGRRENRSATARIRRLDVEIGRWKVELKKKRHAAERARGLVGRVERSRKCIEKL